MSSFNYSFREQDLLFDDVPKEWIQPELYKETKVYLDKLFLKEKELLESLADNTKSSFFSLEDKIKHEKDIQERKREKKNMLFTKIITAKQLLEELLMRKMTLNVNIEMVSKNELSEMLQRVIQLEKEQEVLQDDMKMKAKVFIGQMCFYKNYLNIYVEISNSSDYILYFKMCKAEDNNKPQERIHIKTDDFKKFIVVDFASRENRSNEFLMHIQSSDKHLRELIIEARELLC